MPTQDEYQLELGALLLEAQGNGADHLEVTARDLLDKAGGDAGSAAELAACCRAMRDVAQPTDETIGFSTDEASLTIRYVLPRG